MITDRNFFHEYVSYRSQTAIEEINTHIAFLKNEAIYDFLRTSFDNSKAHELKNINSDHLLQTDEFGQTLLHLSAAKGDAEVTQFIIEKTGIQLFQVLTFTDEYTPLHLAVHGGDNKVINLLMDESKNHNLNDFVNRVDAHGQTVLHLAANNGNLEACKKFYKVMSPDAITCQIHDRLQTALHFAVQGGHYEIAELLLSENKNAVEFLKKQDKYGQSVLHLASPEKAKKIADLLIKTICKLNLYDVFLLRTAKEEYTALHFAVNYNSNDSVKSLVNATKDLLPEFIPAVDIYGQTALHWAASQGNLITCECLCEAMKQDAVNIQTKDSKQTALHFAGLKRNTEIIKLLINKGADINLKDSDGWKALDWCKNI